MTPCQGGLHLLCSSTKRIQSAPKILGLPRSRRARRAMALARRAAAAAAERGEPPALAELLTEASWRRELAGEFARPHAVRLAEFLAGEWRTQAVFPPQPLIFRRGALPPHADSYKTRVGGNLQRVARGNFERPCSVEVAPLTPAVAWLRQGVQQLPL